MQKRLAKQIWQAKILTGVWRRVRYEASFSSKAEKERPAEV